MPSPKSVSLPPSSVSSGRSESPDHLDIQSDRPTPFTSPPPLEQYPAITPDLPDSDMPNDVEPFWGDRDEENPQDFLRSFIRAMGDKSDDHKKKLFVNYLRADSIADEWYSELDTATRADWNLIQEAFNTRWPKSVVAKKTVTEYEEELLGVRLRAEDLGKKEIVAGRDTYTHIVWADKLQKLAKGAGVDGGPTYIGQVRKTLPMVVKEKVGDKYTNWTAFLKAVREIDIDYIKDAAEEIQKRKAQQEADDIRLKRLEAASLASPTAGIRRQMDMTTITAGPPIARNLFGSGRGGGMGGGAGGRGGFQGQSRQPRPPSSAEAQAALRARILTLPHHPDTPAGRTAHQAQQHAWAQIHGVGGWVTELTPYPLRPGTAEVNTGECFRCGHTGHRGTDCTVQVAQQLHQSEQRWRSICSNVLREPRTAVSVRWVAIDDYGGLAPTDTVADTSSSENQGNGEGPSA